MNKATWLAFAALSGLIGASIPAHAETYIRTVDPARYRWVCGEWDAQGRYDTSCGYVLPEQITYGKSNIVHHFTLKDDAEIATFCFPREVPDGDDCSMGSRAYLDPGSFESRRRSCGRIVQTRCNIAEASAFRAKQANAPSYVKFEVCEAGLSHAVSRILDEKAGCETRYLTEAAYARMLEERAAASSQLARSESLDKGIPGDRGFSRSVATERESTGALAL